MCVVCVSVCVRVSVIIVISLECIAIALVISFSFIVLAKFKEREGDGLIYIIIGECVIHISTNYFTLFFHVSSSGPINWVAVIKCTYNIRYIVQVLLLPRHFTFMSGMWAGKTIQIKCKNICGGGHTDRQREKELGREKESKLTANIHEKMLTEISQILYSCE